MEDNKQITNPVKAIRAKCVECSGGSQSEATLCAMRDCPLWPFRAGKNPYRSKRTMSDEQKAELVERLQRGRAKQ